MEQKVALHPWPLKTKRYSGRSVGHGGTLRPQEAMWASVCLAQEVEARRKFLHWLLPGLGCFSHSAEVLQRKGSANPNKAGLDHRSARILGWAQWFNSFFWEDVFYFWSSLPEIGFSWKRKDECGWAYSCHTLSPLLRVSHSPFLSSQRLLLLGGLSGPSRPFSLSLYSHRWSPLSESGQWMPELGHSNSGIKITKTSKQQNRLLHFLNILRIKESQLWHNLLFLNNCFSIILQHGQQVPSFSDK